MENLQRLAEFKKQFGEYKLKEWYPNLQYEKYTFVQDPAYYRIIDDLSDVSQDFSAEMRTLENNCQGFVEVYDNRAVAEQLATSMAPLLNGYDANQLLIVSPGGGGNRLWNAMPEWMKMRYPQIQVQVSRDEADKKKMNITPDSFQNLTTSINVGRQNGLQSVLILDDTINTGSTDRFIRDVSGANDLSWMAASPIMLCPPFSKPKVDSTSSIQGFDYVFASEILTGINEKVPFNFLSSLTKAERNIDGDLRVLNNLLNKAKSPTEEREILKALKSVQETKYGFSTVESPVYQQMYMQ